MREKILEVKNLVTAFTTEQGRITVVDAVSFAVYKGQSLGLVGESGSGKSATALSIMRLIPPTVGEIVCGEVILQGQDLLSLSARAMQAVRGNTVAMIFQEPMTSLNPVYSIGHQIMEALFVHYTIQPRDAQMRCLELLHLVGIPAPAQRMRDYPHQLSGGMRQRVMIAMALACHPALLIADEPTTALDVTVQAQIVDLLKKLQQEMGLGILLITHDLGIVAEMCDDVAVMYAGKLVEQAAVQTLFYHPAHPYTQGLIQAIPAGGKRPIPIEGRVPCLSQLPPGCAFQTRCLRADRVCQGEQGAPVLQELAAGHAVACFHPNVLK